MADYDSLVRQQRGYSIDFMIGQIVEVDNPTHKPSQHGPPQLVQDVVFEDDQGRRFVIQFYDLNMACFTGRWEHNDAEVNFEPLHKGSWVRVENRSNDEHKSTLKRTASDAQASQHYKEKRGIVVVLKATARVHVGPLLDPGQEFPPMRRTRSDKKPPRRRIPGQQPQQESSDMTNGQGGGQQRPPQGGGQQRPPQGGSQERTSQGGNAPPPQTNQAPRPSRDAGAVDRMNNVLIWCEVALLSVYERDGRSAGICMPRSEWLEGPIMAIQICLKDKINVLGATDREVQNSISRLAYLYVDIHLDLEKKFRSHQALSVPEGFEMFKKATASFIGLTRNRAWKLYG